MPGGFQFTTETCVLPFTHPGTYRYFSRGYFAVHKTTELFSVIAFDHAHEQENAKVKVEGGTVCLTENPSALRRRMVAVSELPRMIQELEGSNNPTEENDHHEQKSGTKSAFCKEVLNTLSSFQELYHPVLGVVGNLVVIHTREIVDDTVVLASTRIPSDWKGFA